MEEWLLGIAASAWVIPALFAFCAIDGVFPPVPSESAVIGLAAVSVSSGHPYLALVLVAAAVGAFCGDQVAFSIGRRVELTRVRWLRSGPGRTALDQMSRALEERGASVIVSARFIPVGRIAANMAAGSMGLPRIRFMLADSVAAIVWAVYGVALGALAGAWLRDHPVLAVVVGVVIGLALGYVVDRVMARRRNARAATARAAEAAPEEDPAVEAGGPVEPAD